MADTLEDRQLPSRFLAYLGDMFVKSQQVVNFDSKKDNRVFTLNCCVSEGKVSDLSVALLAETDCLKFIRFGLRLVFFEPKQN